MNFKLGALVLSVSLVTVRVILSHDLGDRVYGHLASSAFLTKHHDGGGVGEEAERVQESSRTNIFPRTTHSDTLPPAELHYLKFSPPPK